MNRRQHATQARLLIKLCGGLAEAAENCRIGKSQLAECQAPDGETFMPADVICDLETHCGQRPYSRALLEAGADAQLVRDLTNEACEAVETAVGLQRHIRLAAANGRLTPTERARLAGLHAEASVELAQVGEILARDAG